MTSASRPDGQAFGAPTLSPPEYLTVPQVAALLQVSVKTVYRISREEKTFPVVKLGRGKNATVRFHRERLNRWLAAREQGSRFQKQARSTANDAPTLADLSP